MKLISIVILLSLLSAFSIGINLQGIGDREIIDDAMITLDSAFDNISLEQNMTNENINLNPFFRVIENYIQFVGSLFVETMRTGISFGQDNPEYFSAEFIIRIMKLIVILFIVSLIIQPALYLVVLLIMGVIWAKEILIKRKQKKEERNGIRFNS